MNYISVPLRLLADLIDMSRSHVDDITSGVEEGIYDAAENQDIGAKEQTIITAETLYREAMGVPASPVATTQCHRCGSNVTGGYCSDDTCPYSDWPQCVPINDLHDNTLDAIQAKHNLRKRQRVKAEIHSDDRLFVANFDAAAWLSQADDEAIIALHAISWGGDYASDVVAEFFEATNSDIANIFDYCRKTHNTSRAMGFECIVEEISGLAWLKQHRYGLWARLVCENEGIMVVKEATNNTYGWDDAKSNESSWGYSTAEDAAISAVKTFHLGEVA